MDLIRTKQDGCFRPTADPWGMAFDPVADPLAELESRPEFQYTAPKIAGDQWRAVVSLFDYLATPSNPTTGGTSEVQVVLARPVDGSQDRFRIFVPKQEVDRTEVEADMSLLLEIESGEQFAGLPDGWADAGTIHSHNTMGAFWSSTDNQDQVKRWGLHLVVGDLDKAQYTIKARVTRPNQVVDLPWQVVADATAVPSEPTFHRDVLSVVSLKKPTFVWGPGISRLCQYFKCYADRVEGSSYCVEHRGRPAKTLCRELICMDEVRSGSNYCAEHGEQRRADVPQELKGEAEENLLANIASLIEEYEQDYGPLSESFVQRLRGEDDDVSL